MTERELIESAAKNVQPSTELEYLVLILVGGFFLCLLIWFIAWLKMGRKSDYKGEERRADCVIHSEDMASMKARVDHLEQGLERVESKVDAGFAKGDTRMKSIEDTLQALEVRVAGMKGDVLEAIQEALKGK